LKKWSLFGQDNFRIVSVGRISEIKNLLLLIRAVDLLVHEFGLQDLAVFFIGAPPDASGKEYAALLKREIKKLQLEEYISWAGTVPNQDLPDYYHQADLSVNLCPTGGLDKVVLESMACGIPPIVYNRTFAKILSAYQDLLLLPQADGRVLAGKIRQIIKLDLAGRQKLGENLRQIVVSDYSIKKLVTKIAKVYEGKN
jgi:glycosyltransferase involved in cell wall biosynthesis